MTVALCVNMRPYTRPIQTRQTIVITGANSGIGFDAAQKLAARGHKVYVACRTQAKADATAQATGAAGAFECDLSSLQSVRRFLDAWGARPIDVLCLNAGVAMNTGDKTPKCVPEGRLAVVCDVAR